ncbi:MAG: quinolinate synthase NadA [Bacteroidales bacterium]|jgi:quinolinate synthase|nr:quinolinate synthase NadA [Bacteroidales bacterium]
MNNIVVKRIKSLLQEKNAIILAHYYQEAEIQDIADFVGDSLALAQKAMDTKADIIVLAGVHFMAETAKILNPSKKVLLPAPDAGCSLADSCPAEAFGAFVKAHPEHTVVSYVNTTAAVKAVTDIVCTSSNAVQIIESLPKDEKIIFAPDRNLGDYIKRLTNRDILVWDGACHVHEAFSLERILDLKKQYPEAKILAHPECPKPVLIVANHIGSTAALLKFSQTDPATTYIVATESGILHQMQKASPAKTFIPAPPADSTCACNDCRYMKLVTLQKICDCLESEKPEIILDKNLCAKAEKPILRMMEISKKLKLI